MRLLYMGTAAAEGIPALFCTCPVCAAARGATDRKQRTRSQALIDGKILLDLPPDTYQHYLRFKFDLPAVTRLFITHSHTDHFCPTELEWRRRPYLLQDPPPAPLHVYGNHAVETGVKAIMKDADPKAAKLVTFHYAEPFTPIKADGYRVIPFLASHSKNEECLFYAVERDGRALLYAHDTGVFPEETWKRIKSSRLRFNLVSLDCTTMGNSCEDYHMGLPQNQEVRQRLLDMGAADERTVFALNHFSHGGGWTFDELFRHAEDLGFLISWDGREIAV